MALFTVQLVFTLIFLSVLNRLSVHYSIGRWLLSKGLIRYLPPTDDQLRQLLGLSKSSVKTKNRKDNKEQQKSNTFTVPRDISLELVSKPVDLLDVIQLPYYAEVQWLFDFSAYAVVVYILTEFYYFLVPNSNEYNLSLIWCSFVVAFSLKVLLSITGLYFRGGDEAIGERSVTIVSASLFFLSAMIVLIADENFLEFGLVPAYKSFNESAFKLLETHNISDSTGSGGGAGPTSFLIIKFCLAIWCAFVGAFFTFPGFRLARMHFDAIKYAQNDHFSLLLLNVSFISPLFIILLWIKPIARDYLTIRSWSRGTIMSADSFETTRILIIVVVIALRLCLIKRYLQSYLNIAPQKLTIMKKERGRITNVDLQRMIARVFHYLCVVTLQYISPLFICLFMVLMMKTLGNYSWSSYLLPIIQMDEIPVNLDETTGPQLTLALLRNVFNPIVLRGLMGFMVWWLCSVWFVTSSIGLLYHSYFL
ncbi:transmembrane protein 161B-like [Oppia nitens]|uniref:transmembrane protein 161B-like n=1 Tax=Oppia nitens TaxID=1686743 RepID=UPI0023DC9895|nr:transmembrane protein 161B-like [Oppia nitens]